MVEHIWRKAAPAKDHPGAYALCIEELDFLPGDIKPRNTSCGLVSKRKGQAVRRSGGPTGSHL